MPRPANVVSGSERGEVMPEAQRRRRWSFIQKLRAAQEASAPGMTVSSVARKYGMAPSQLFRWRKLLSKGSQETALADDQVVVVGQMTELRRQIRELERLLGKKTLENELLRETIALEKSKRQPWSEHRRPEDGIR
ncbi:MAG: transposase [Nitrospiraceae bacterium]